MKTASYTIVLEPAEEGGYNVSVPALPGCVTQGDTYQEAIAMAEDAISLWLESLTSDGKSIPVETATLGVEVAQVKVIVPTGV